MSRTHWLKSRGPYPCNIGFSSDSRAFMRTWKQLTDETTPTEHCNSNGARTWQFPQPKNDLVPTYIICIEPGQTSWAEVAGMIAHEATHVCQYLWRQIGETEPGWEAEAYLVQSITREILNIMGCPARGSGS